ncbi:hypothetical protein I4U23_019995 [Adineta vaga]|nr:hypothetical protein I4U23_019995 [Adineta vaga]
MIVVSIILSTKNIHSRYKRQQYETNSSFSPWRCNRGLEIAVGSIDNRMCLCPPAYYGETCQYQNQRFQTYEYLTAFSIVVALVDNRTQAHSMEQFTHLSLQDCSNKYDVNLLYSTRPKQFSVNYSLHIHIYDKSSLKYRAKIPVDEIVQNNQYNLKYGEHGRCISFINNNMDSFCQCERGWSGPICNIFHACQHNRSYCENENTRIDISFSHDIIISSSIIAHFITVSNNSHPTYSSIYKKIGFDRVEIIFYISDTFHIIFVEFYHTYYLLILQQYHTSKNHIIAQVRSSQQCAQITELFNGTILNLPPLHRIKYH